MWGRGASRAPWLECSVQWFPWLLSILLLAGDRRKKQYCVPAASFGGGGFIAGSALAVYEDISIGGAKAIAAHEKRSSGVYVVDALPFADGIYDFDLRSGSDFSVMRYGICRSLLANEQLNGQDYCEPAP